MGMKFNAQIHQLQRANDIYYKQITLFDMLCRDGNVLISLHELNAGDILKKLKMVEMDAHVIWKSLEKVFGFGYFNKVIEDEFGITPDF